MNASRALLLFIACLLPLQAALAGAGSVAMTPVVAEMVDMPCQSAGDDCCDDDCPQMAACVAGAAMCPPAVLKISVPASSDAYLLLQVTGPPPASPDHIFRPPILLAA